MKEPQLIWDEPAQNKVLNAVAKSKPEYRAEGIAYLRQNRAPAALIERAEAIHARLLLKERQQPFYAPQQQVPTHPVDPALKLAVIQVGLMVAAGWLVSPLIPALFYAAKLAWYAGRSGVFHRQGGEYGSARPSDWGAHPSRGGKEPAPTPKTRITIETW